MVASMHYVHDDAMRTRASDLSIATIADRPASDASHRLATPRWAG